MENFKIDSSDSLKIKCFKKLLETLINELKLKGRIVNKLGIIERSCNEGKCSCIYENSFSTKFKNKISEIYSPYLFQEIDEENEEELDFIETYNKIESKNQELYYSFVKYQPEIILDLYMGYRINGKIIDNFIITITTNKYLYIYSMENGNLAVSDIFRNEYIDRNDSTRFINMVSNFIIDSENNEKEILKFFENLKDLEFLSFE